jgi:hypothetical protein
VGKKWTFVNEIIIPTTKKRAGAKFILAGFLEGLQTPTVVILVD